MDRRLRSNIPKVDLGTSVYSAVEEFPGRQVPTGKEVIGRMMFLTSKDIKHPVQFTVQTAALQVSKELQDLMIHNLNVYPLTLRNIRDKVIGDYQEFKKVSHYPRAKRSGQTYQTSCQILNSRLETGYDIKTNDPDRQEKLAKEHGVEFGEAEIILYEDNIKAKACVCAQNSVTKCPECPRQVFADHSVDKDWLKAEREKEEELAKEMKAKEKSDQEVTQLFNKVNSDTIPIQVDQDIPTVKDTDENVFTSPIPLTTFEKTTT